MAATASEIIALAQSTKALSTAQLQKILELAPKMGGADLESLKQMILAVQAADEKAMEEEIEIRSSVGARYKEFKADKARNEIQKNETASRLQEHEMASHLIQNL